jgi:hypothetical protein
MSAAKNGRQSSTTASGTIGLFDDTGTANPAVPSSRSTERIRIHAKQPVPQVLDAGGAVVQTLSNKYLITFFFWKSD